LSCRYAAEIPIVHSPDHSIVRPFVHSSYSSFIVRSSSLFSVHRSFIRLFTITFHRYYSPLLFTIVTIPRCYLSTLFTIVTIHHRYYSPMISMVTFCCYYSSLLFVDHPITPNFNYSSIMLSNPPKTSQTHIPVIRTPVTVIFLPVGNFPSGHPS
jgi:hypothetical protein